MQAFSGVARVNWRLILWLVIGGLLPPPLIAMQFTPDVRWTAFDFVVAAILLVGGGAAYELGARVFPATRHRLIIGAALLAVVMLIWIDGAVGIF